MGFKQGKFVEAKFVPRTAEITIPALKEWFDKDDKPVFKIRGLTANELAKANEAMDRSDQLRALVEAFAGGGKTKELSDNFKEAFGLGDDTPREIMKRINMLTTASVEPDLEMRTAVKLAETFPIEFYQLTNKITELTGLGGYVEGKSQPSGQTPQSESPASSQKLEEGSSTS